MQKLRFEITITLGDESELSSDEVAAELSDTVGTFFGDDNPSIKDFDIIFLSEENVT